jgi:hypothetical protein
VKYAVIRAEIGLHAHSMGHRSLCRSTGLHPASPLPRYVRPCIRSRRWDRHMALVCPSPFSLAQSSRQVLYGLAVEISEPPAFKPSGLSQHEVFENELSIPTGKWCSAGSTRHVVVNRLRSTFAFDDLIPCLAFRACEGSWPASRHSSPHRLLCVPTGTIRMVCDSRNVTRSSQQPVTILCDCPQPFGNPW